MTRSKYTTLQEIQDNCAMEPNTGSWLWMSSLSEGYGRARDEETGRREGIHRLAFRLAGGVIPDNLQLDHICRQRSCCNPAHLRVVTIRENVLAPGSLSISAQNATATHCKNGHPLSGDNLYVYPCGDRECRTCHMERERKRRMERRGEVNACKRRWYAKHREEVCAQLRARYAADKARSLDKLTRRT